ncbi:MAG: hypothetical protein RIT03_1222 [Bacteroidota bacterium]|jgi:hypothetical protein
MLVIKSFILLLIKKKQSKGLLFFDSSIPKHQLIKKALLSKSFFTYPERSNMKFDSSPNEKTPSFEEVFKYPEPSNKKSLTRPLN